jgi:hypothetical protein
MLHSSREMDQARLVSLESSSALSSPPGRMGNDLLLRLVFDLIATNWYDVR